MPSCVTAPSSSRCSARRSGCLCEKAGQRGGATVRIDHEEVTGVGADVEDAQAHARHATRLAPVPEVDLVFPRAYVEFADPADEDPGLPLRPDLADVELHVHLRPGLPGHLRRRTRRRLLHAGRALRRQGRRVAGRGVRRPADARRLAVPPRAGGEEVRLGRDRRRRRAQDAGGASTTASRRASSTTAPTSPRGRRRRCRLRAARPRAAAGPQPAGDQARRVLAAADPSPVPHRRAAGRDVLHRGRRSASTTAAAGVRAGTTSTGTARATPRRTSPWSRSSSPTRPSWSS